MQVEALENRNFEMFRNEVVKLLTGVVQSVAGSVPVEQPHNVHNRGFHSSLAELM